MSRLLPANSPPDLPVPVASPPPEGEALAPLPRFLTPFVGREQQIADLRALVLRPDAPLVTLIGPGGVGKTRLAVLVAEGVLDAFPDGVAFVALAAVRDPDLVLPTIAATLGVRDTGDRPLGARLAEFLQHRQLLLVLDNLEQILEAAPRLAELLAACPNLTILATSRAPLVVSGERAFDVPPLSLPPVENRAAPLAHDDLGEAEAVRLFVERARAARADFALTRSNAEAVAEICRRLDGLPLAIELAAARVRAFPPPALRVRLERRLPLLTGGARDVPQRLRTMRDAIGWSFDLLDTQEQALFRRLAIFAGGFTLEAAEFVGSDGDNDAFILDAIASLVDKSLLRQDDGPDGEPRYLLLETVREFGLEQLAAHGETEAVGERHAALYLSLAEQAAPALFGPEQRRWARRLDRENANLRAALAWLAARPERGMTPRLAGSLLMFWFLRGYLREGAGWLERSLEQSESVAPTDRAWAMFGAALLTWARGDFVHAIELGEAALALARGHGLIFEEGMALYVLFLVRMEQLQNDAAVVLGEQAIASMRESGNRTWLAYMLSDVGELIMSMGDRGRGEAMIEEGLGLHRELGNKQGLGNKLSDLGLHRHDEGDDTAAARHYKESVRLLWEGGDTWYLASPVAGLAAIALQAGEVALAARLIGAAMAMRERSAAAFWPKERARVEQTIAGLRDALGEEGFAREVAAGRGLPLAGVVTLAAQAPEPAARGGSAADGGLSPRELEVLRLLAAGKSNPEIAEALYIGRGTVRTHVSNILAKLDARTRTEASALARDRGLV